MNERGTGVLEQYELEVYRTCRARGAVLCETGKGLKLLKEWAGSRKRIWLFFDKIYKGGDSAEYLFWYPL